jgi:hypothetical protein
MEKNIHCHDGSLAPMIAKHNANGSWDIFGISEVFGMGSADYKTKLFDFVISDLMILNSTNGTSYVCLKKEQKWGLLEIKDNETNECNWKIISEFTYPTAEKMLSDFKINRLEYFK